MNDTLALARLLQLASPALPVGAYTYSQGLEWAVESGVIRDEAGAARWIGDLLAHAIGRFEAPLLARQMQAWRDAAAELGFALDVVGDSQLLRDPAGWRDAALILPDTVHRRANEALLAHLTRRVAAGARLMLVHDAAVLDMDGHYHPEQARLSPLAGVRYALWGALGTGMLREQQAQVLPQALPALQLPPGKLLRDSTGRPLTSVPPLPTAQERLTVVGYQYGPLRYPMFRTAGAYDGERLMAAADDTLLAGLREVGRGRVLFVNLPLGYLKLRTDGLLLHSLLRLFAQDVALLPQLSPMPQGRGALVMNWHIDSAAAVPAMQQLADLGAFDQGPYSVHLTAGPDVDRDGDGLGMDLARNAVMRDWVRRFAARGDEIGSHGGWTHNAFGQMVGTQDRAQSAAMIERNSLAVAEASGRPVREYSAPTGNHPAWVTGWLHERGVQAFYFTGDSGMAPTRSFQDGHRPPPGMWAFPVLSQGQVAAFEEAHRQGMPEADVAAWLADVSDFCADAHTLRLVYFHPSGVMLYPAAFKAWLRHSRQLVEAGRLRWMTMAQYADFANRRLRVLWRIEPLDGAASLAGVGPVGPPGAGTGSAAAPAQRLAASHDEDLAGATWMLPVQRWAEPRLAEGEARIARDGAFWRVEAVRGKRLVLDLLPAVAAAAGAPSFAPSPAPSSAPSSAPSPVPALPPAARAQPPADPLPSPVARIES